MFTMQTLAYDGLRVGKRDQLQHEKRQSAEHGEFCGTHTVNLGKFAHDGSQTQLVRVRPIGVVMLECTELSSSKFEKGSGIFHEVDGIARW